MSGSTRRDALGRHPSASGWRPEPRRFTNRMARVYEREGRHYPHVAAAVQSARGLTGETLSEFAERLGLAPAWLARLESGEVGADVVPTVVTAAAPWVDWPSLRST